jgi:hypothetical protein
MTIWQTIFHRHIFDPEKWVKINKTEVFNVWPNGKSDLPCKVFFTYNNTCKECGVLVSKNIKV